MMCNELNRESINTNIIEHVTFKYENRVLLILYLNFILHIYIYIYVLLEQDVINKYKTINKLTI